MVSAVMLALIIMNNHAIPVTPIYKVPSLNSATNAPPATDVKAPLNSTSISIIAHPPINSPVAMNCTDFIGSDAHKIWLCWVTSTVNSTNNSTTTESQDVTWGGFIYWTFVWMLPLGCAILLIAECMKRTNM